MAIVVHVQKASRKTCSGIRTANKWFKFSVRWAIRTTFSVVVTYFIGMHFGQNAVLSAMLDSITSPAFLESWAMLTVPIFVIYLLAKWLEPRWKAFLDYILERTETYGARGTLLKYNSPDCDRDLWKKLPQFWKLKFLKRITEDGKPICWCGSTELKDWGLSSAGDHERAHICVRCNYAIYRSER